MGYRRTIAASPHHSSPSLCQAYLGKILKRVKDATGEQLEMQPSKVVAGKEPEHTNLFLQALARAAGATDDGAASRRSPSHSSNLLGSSAPADGDWLGRGDAEEQVRPPIPLALRATPSL